MTQIDVGMFTYFIQQTCCQKKLYMWDKSIYKVTSSGGITSMYGTYARPII